VHRRDELRVSAEFIGQDDEGGCPAGRGAQNAGEKVEIGNGPKQPAQGHPREDQKSRHQATG